MPLTLAGTNHVVPGHGDALDRRTIHRTGPGPGPARGDMRRPPAGRARTAAPVAS